MRKHSKVSLSPVSRWYRTSTESLAQSTIIRSANLWQYLSIKHAIASKHRQQSTSTGYPTSGSSSGSRGPTITNPLGCSSNPTQQTQSCPARMSRGTLTFHKTRSRTTGDAGAKAEESGQCRSPSERRKGQASRMSNRATRCCMKAYSISEKKEHHHKAPHTSHRSHASSFMSAHGSALCEAAHASFGLHAISCHCSISLVNSGCGD